MLALDPQIFGITFQAFFPKPLPFAKSSVLLAAEDIAQAFQPLGLKPSQLELIKRDEVFNFDLRVSMFNGNGNFSLNAERIEVTFSNGRTREDLSLIARCLLTFQEAAHLPEGRTGLFNAHVHGLPTRDEAEKYFLAFAPNSEGFTLRGFVANLRVGTWKDEIRLYVDQSNVVAGGVFVNWSTTLPGGIVTEAGLQQLVQSFEAVSGTVGIKFADIK